MLSELALQYKKDPLSFIKMISGPLLVVIGGIISIVITGTYYISGMEKRLALLEQHDTFVSLQVAGLDEKLERIEDKSDKIYLLIAEKSQGRQQ